MTDAERLALILQDRSVPMATPTGEFIPTPPTQSQQQWEAALKPKKLADMLYGGGEAAASILSSPLPYVSGALGYGYGALTGKDPKQTGMEWEQAATLSPKTALGQYYTEQASDKLGALPPVVSGIPAPRLGAGATRYAGQQYGVPMLEKSLTMYEQGRLTPGMKPVSEMADTSYKGSHVAPNAETYGATLDNLTGIMPADVYSSKGIRLYGINDPAIDREWFAAAYRAKNKPDAEVTVWRAVPKGVKDINSGDWVTTSQTYAKNHGENTLNGEYDLISSKVKANTLSSEGYPYEFGYNAPKPTFAIEKTDASSTFGQGAQQIRYTDPNSGGFIKVVQKPDGTASVLGLEVPKEFQGTGVGKKLQAQVMADFPTMEGQVSSKAAAKNAYDLGRRPIGNPNASLKDILKMIDEDTSVNLVSPDMQKLRTLPTRKELLQQEFDKLEK
jgi:hypothetical protein